MERECPAGAAFVKKLEQFEKAATGAGIGGTETGTGVSVHRAAMEKELGVEGSLAAEAAKLLTREVRTAPTLVKYAEPNQYLIQTRAELEQAAPNCSRESRHRAGAVVDLVERTENLEVELAATLIYWASDHPYRQVARHRRRPAGARIAEIIELGLRHRGRHDEALRAFHAGAALRFDILMDIGGFRDMHRHRRVTQIKQGFTAQQGYETPADSAATLTGSKKPAFSADYQAAIEAAHAASAQIAAGSAPEARRRRSICCRWPRASAASSKWTSPKRSTSANCAPAPAGHFSYRRVAWEMYLALQRQHPALAKHIRATDFTQPIDLLQR